MQIGTSSPQGQTSVLGQAAQSHPADIIVIIVIVAVVVIADMLSLNLSTAARMEVRPRR